MTPSLATELFSLSFFLSRSFALSFSLLLAPPLHFFSVSLALSFALLLSLSSSLSLFLCFVSLLFYYFALHSMQSISMHDRIIFVSAIDFYSPNVFPLGYFERSIPVHEYLRFFPLFLFSCVV